MGMTMSEKIIAKSSERSYVVPGDAVLLDVYTFSMWDFEGYDLPWLDSNGLQLARPDRVVICFDHLHRTSPGVAQPMMRSFADRYGIPRDQVYDIGRHGLSHQVPAEEGWVVPGTVYVGHDTQGATMGAFNCFAIAGMSSFVPSLVLGKVWVVVPETIKLTLTGELRPGVLGKDVYMQLLHDLDGAAVGRVLEVTGLGVESLPIDIRMSIANGSNHVGAVSTVFEADGRLENYLADRTRDVYAPVTADDDAVYIEAHEYDLGSFEPIVSGPHDPARVRPLRDLVGTPVQAAYIGSCNSGRLADLEAAAEVLRSKRIHPGVRLIVTPISSRVHAAATRSGVIDTLLTAGAAVTTPGCGACHAGLGTPLALSAGETCISSSVENWPGRMGSEKAEIYLANSAVVAASALEGRIADPRPYLRGAE